MSLERVDGKDNGVENELILLMQINKKKKRCISVFNFAIQKPLRLLEKEKNGEANFIN